MNIPLDFGLLLVLDILLIFQYIAEYPAGYWVVAGSKYTANIPILLNISLDIAFSDDSEYIAAYPDVHWVGADY